MDKRDRVPNAVDTQNCLSAILWRRGRKAQRWNFVYVISANAEWFTTPGWYHFARKFIYRLTIDHDFPGNPIWLGRREKGKWVNMEQLYEPLTVEHKDFVIASRDFRKNASRRSEFRKERSAGVVRPSSTWA